MLPQTSPAGWQPAVIEVSLVFCPHHHNNLVSKLHMWSDQRNWPHLVGRKTLFDATADDVSRQARSMWACAPACFLQPKTADVHRGAFNVPMITIFGQCTFGGDLQTQDGTRSHSSDAVIHRVFLLAFSAHQHRSCSVPTVDVSLSPPHHTWAGLLLKRINSGVKYFYFCKRQE